MSISSEQALFDGSAVPDAQESTAATEANNRALQAYYQLHSKIYDLTRWSFLFGRQAIVDAAVDVAARAQQPQRILEVGCGTGKNLLTLKNRFPQASITGLDLSAEMLKVARKNTNATVTFQQGAYGTVPQPHQYDLILFSYALTMFNPGWEAAIEQAYADLRPGGMIAIVDFHDSRLVAFKRWMGVNHVRMDGHLLPKVNQHFSAKVVKVNPAYGGLWAYLLFVGEK